LNIYNGVKGKQPQVNLYSPGPKWNNTISLY